MNAKPKVSWPRELALSFTALAAFSAPLVPVQSANTERVPVRVLLLHESDLMLASAIEQDSITRNAIQAAVSGPMEFYSEGFDVPRFPGQKLEAEFIALLQMKYAQRPPHLIVAHGPALARVAAIRARLWPTIPLMFTSVAAHRLTDQGFPGELPGTTARFDVSGTVDLAMQLQPDARRLLVITGSSEFDRSWKARIVPELERYRKQLAVQFAAERSVEEFEEIVSTADPRTIVLFASVLRDASGRVFRMGQPMHLIANASKAPVYSLYPARLEVAAVGGSVVDWNAQSVSVGDIARRLLSGERPENIPIAAAAPPRCIVDWRQLRHWEISTERVPPNCEVLYREPSLWDRYRTEVITAIFVLLVQAGLIIALLRQRRMRQQATLEAEHRRAELEHASRLATVGELSASIAHEINQPLSAILNNATAGQLILAVENPPLAEIKEILGEIRRDDERASEVIRKLRQLLRKHPVETEVLDVNEVVNAVLHLVEGTALRRGIAIVAQLGNALPLVRGDRVQLEQVILNLIMNAFDAMADTSAPRRRLNVRVEERPQGNVEIAIGDEGCGIPPDQLAKVFEPFHSTKREGMGLGLSIARSIVQAHHGKIWAEPAAAGTTFRFTIPGERSHTMTRTESSDPGMTTVVEPARSTT